MENEHDSVQRSTLPIPDLAYTGTVTLNKPRITASTGPDGVLTVTLLAPLYTANVLATEQAVLVAADAVPDLRILVLDITVLQEISFTVLETLEDLDRELAGRGVELRLARLPVAARDVAERTAWFAGLEQAGRVDRP